jgi:tRNA(fMet)-specific endonuclease VapC
MPYLLDTNICIYVIRKRHNGVIERFRQHSLNDLMISSLSTAELYFGIGKSERREHNLDVLERFLLPLTVYPFDDEASKIYGRLRVNLEGRGTPIGPLALSLDATLVSNNTREFSRVPGLRLEDWTVA